MKDSFKLSLINLGFFLTALALVLSGINRGSILLLLALLFIMGIFNYRKLKVIFVKNLSERTDRENLLGKILEAAPQGIFLIDNKGIILDLNRKAESWFLENKEEIKGQSLFRNVDCDIKRTEIFKTIFFNDLGTHFPAEVQVRALEPGELWKYAVYVEDLTEMIREQDKLLKLANEDALTGLLNRRSFLHEMQKEIERSSRTGLPCSLALIDLDHFKNINDTFGHDFGDEVLITFSNILKENSRQLDIICRYGGEEFLILLPHTNPENSHHFLKRVRDQFAHHQYSNEIAPTFSCGVVNGELKGDGKNMERLLKEADLLLYLAKNSGRNRIETSDTNKMELLQKKTVLSSS